MKSAIIVLLVFLGTGFRSFADCAGNRLYAFPNSGKIAVSSIFILNGYAQSQQIITGLNTTFPVYLKSGDERIALKVIETLTGQFSVNQAVLKPEKELTAGKEYQLIIDQLPEYEKLGNYNSKTQTYDPITYVATNERDTEIPQWIRKPEEKDKSLIHHGCGPSIYVNFRLKIKDQSGCLIKTTVKSAETGTETTYYIGEGGEGLSIGHGMCAGAFAFEEGTDYQVKFAIMDLSGNVSAETEWIGFTKPLD